MMTGVKDGSLDLVDQHVETLVMLGEAVQAQRSGSDAVGYFRRALMLVADRDSLKSSRIREKLQAASSTE